MEEHDVNIPDLKAQMRVGKDTGTQQSIEAPSGDFYYFYHATEDYMILGPKGV